jgi:hypothetical protein
MNHRLLSTKNDNYDSMEKGPGVYYSLDKEVELHYYEAMHISDARFIARSH